MIDVASPARRSCITIDAVDCAPVVPKPTPAATQWACRMAGDQRQRCSVTPVHTPQSLTLCRPGAGCHLSHVASAADVSGQQIVTQHTANWA